MCHRHPKLPARKTSPRRQVRPHLHGSPGARSPSGSPTRGSTFSSANTSPCEDSRLQTNRCGTRNRTSLNLPAPKPNSPHTSLRYARRNTWQRLGMQEKPLACALNMLSLTTHLPPPVHDMHKASVAMHWVARGLACLSPFHASTRNTPPSPAPPRLAK